MRTDRLLTGLFGFMFRDPARPIELISVIYVLGWAWLFFTSPEILTRDGYAGFNALPAIGWVFLLTLIAIVQLAAMLPAVPSRGALRFVAMACSAGIWTIVAINFTSAAVPTSGALTYPGFALVTAMCGVWCGWNRS